MVFLKSATNIWAIWCRFEKSLPVKKIFFLALLIVTTCRAWSQPLIDSNIIEVSAIKDSTKIGTKSLFYLGNEKNLPPIQIQSLAFEALSKLKLKNNYVPVQKNTQQLYLKFTLYNASDSALKVYFFPCVQIHKMNFYALQKDKEIFAINNEGLPNGYQQLNLNAKETTTFFGQIQFSKMDRVVLNPQIISKNYIDRYKKILHFKDEGVIVSGYILSGLLVMMMAFTFINFLQTNKKEFLYNFFYSLSLFFLIFFSAYYDKRSGYFPDLFFGYFDFLFLVCSTIFYVAFTRKFLDTKNNYPVLQKIFVAEEGGLFFLLALYTYLHFFTNQFEIENYLENIVKIISLLLGLVYIFIALKQKDKLMNYLAIGNSCLIFFAMISLYMIFAKHDRTSILTNSLAYYHLGIFCELIFFLTGLSYKNRKEVIEKTKEQEKMKLQAEKKEFETQIQIIRAQQEERNRISADMHDDLGAGMTTIRLYSELVKNKLDGKILPEIEKISSSANELLTKMNAIIWSMSNTNDSLGSMVAYIRSYALEYFENTGIACNIILPNDLPNVYVIGEVRRNVFLVVKEALHNIIKHSKATEVNIELLRVADDLILYIQDNGLGIDIKNVRQFGNGLKNMKNRMNSMEIDFAITKNEKGTLVTLQKKLVF
jgi:signal transduction histidine kinase